MNTLNFIAITQLSTHYDVEVSFFSSLAEHGIIEIHHIENEQFIDPEKLEVVEKVLRLYNELQINLEGIDVVLNLLNKIEDLQSELILTKNKLRLYEGL